MAGRRLLWMAAGAGCFAALAAAVGFGMLFLGVYDVSASSGHTQAVYWLLERGMQASVRRHAAGIQAPADIDSAELRRLGAHCFHEHCVQCHGAPGISPHEEGKGLLPIPNSLTQTARDWPVEYVYWVTRSGIRMAGMPAWEYRFADRDLWAIAAFVDRELPRLTVTEYAQRISEASDQQCSSPRGSEPSDSERGRVALRQYACHGCHSIPGITGPDIHVGPPLEGFASRGLIAGVLPNTRENLLLWLQSPQSIRPKSMMPDLGVTEAHARDMVAYLETLK